MGSCSKKITSRTVKNFGRLDRLLEEDPQILEKLEAQAQRYKQLAQEEKQQILKQRIKNVEPSSPKGTHQCRDNRVVMAGACVYRQIWDKLDLTRKLTDLVKDKTIGFNFADAIFQMTCARVLMPEAKLSQWKKQNSFLFSAAELELKHLYQSLHGLGETKATLVEYLNKRLSKVYNRVISAVVHDVTSYSFESQDSNGHPIQITMGLLMDKNGIPIDYQLFPAHQSESAITEFNNHYGITSPEGDLSPDDDLPDHPRKVETSFPITKSLFEDSPSFHDSEQSLQAHFLIGYLALVLQRLIEFELREKGVHLSSAEITEALSGALLMEVCPPNSDAIYCKARMEGTFETIATTLGLGTLKTVSTPAQVKQALHLRDFS